MKNMRRKHLTLKCDERAKAERVKCFSEHRHKKIRVRGKFCIVNRTEVLEKSASEALKSMDTIKNQMDHLREKCGEDWRHMDVNARNTFNNCTGSINKCPARVTM